MWLLTASAKIVDGGPRLATPTRQDLVSREPRPRVGLSLRTCEQLYTHDAMMSARDGCVAAFLRERFEGEGNFDLREGDALEILPDLAKKEHFPVVCGNLPYNISTPLIMTLLEWPQPPRRMVFTLQRELAQRLASMPRTKEYSALSIIVQAEYGVTILKKLPHTIFYPEPEVESAAVLLEARPEPLIAPEHRVEFRALVKKGFSQRRKKLSNLIGGTDSRRAEELTVEEWCHLAAATG